jgi:predicted short-subunit dehydrogenase-like oxidoreductase (DUF2520 family)
MRFSVIGPGKVGSSLGRALVKEGWHSSSILGKSRSASELRELKKQFPRTRLLASHSLLGSDFDVLFLTVGDDVIESVASEIAQVRGIDWTGKVVLHASGIVPVASLREFKHAGASVGAFHPVAAFANRFSPSSARNIQYDFFGDPAALRVVRRIVKALSSKLLVLRSEEDRERLHIASVIVSNFTVIGSVTARRLVSQFVSPGRRNLLFNSLLASTLENLSRDGGVSSLTGPLARGDLKVIERHMRALESNNPLLQFYTSASLLGIDMLLKDEKQPAERQKLLRIKEMMEG